MPQYIILRMYPDQPLNGTDFTTLLTGLSISVLDRSYNHPEGALIGTATYSSQTSATNIVQHLWKETNPPKKHWESVATAVIEVPVGPEYASLDLKVVVYRGGQVLRTFDWHPNATTLTATQPPTKASYPTLFPVTAYLAIPDPSQAVDPDPAHIELADDGLTPSFDQLATAVAIAHAKNPGATPNLAALTVPQCLALAYEITWDHSLYSLPLLPPTPPMSLEVMYTLDYVYPPAGGTARNASAAQSAVDAFTAVHTAQWNNAATRMSQYIYAYSAALACADASRNATAALLSVPVHTAGNAEPGKIAEVEINLTFTPAPGLRFEVPATYFYALTVGLPTSMGPSVRYQDAVGNDPATNGKRLKDAITAGTIAIDPGVNVAQAVRRLAALAGQHGTLVAVVNTPATIALVGAWLAYSGDDIAAFWSVAVAPSVGPQLAGQLELILEIVTDDRPLLMSAIEAIPISDVDQLASLTENDWIKFFDPHPGVPSSTHPASPRVALLSPTLAPGASEGEQVMAFVNRLRTFYTVTKVATLPPDILAGEPPQLDVGSTDLLQQFAATYQQQTGQAFTFTAGAVPSEVAAAIQAVAGKDACVQRWLTQAIETGFELYQLASVAPLKMRLSIMEALYARGFASIASVKERSRDDFRAALTGSVAFEYADPIFDTAGGQQASQSEEEPFLPVNPDGLLTNCIPPPQLSPLGPVAYLHEALRLSAASSCADPAPPEPGVPPLGSLLAQRRGPLGDLAVTESNLLTPIPLVDLANECLEAMVAGSAQGVVHDTASSTLAGHRLLPPGATAHGHLDGHDPAVLLGALPEHSSPATPVAIPAAYDTLRQDFSAPGLPYSQALDVNRAYLHHLGTSRFEVMRGFRKDVREFLADPALEPAGFARHLARTPYRPELFCEYLGISPEEYQALFTVTTVPVTTLYGYAATATAWMQNLSQLAEFLKRTGLSYCEVVELWQSPFIASQYLEAKVPVFPACEPCCLADFPISFPTIGGTEPFLLRVALFIRVWRKLQAFATGKYSFAELSDIASILGMFLPNGAIHPDFIRQLAAFQMLRDDLRLPLVDRDDRGAPPNPTGADRTHILALWKGPAARKYGWAVERLLHHLHGHAQHRHGCGRRSPDFIKLLRDHLGPLAVLSGTDPWDRNPTHTLRVVEILVKIYASDFTVGEILFLFTNEPHLDGDDPFPLPTLEESLDSPLDLPDDDAPHSLWALRQKLLAVEPSDEEVCKWTWTRIESSLRHEFGHVPPTAGPDPLISLGQHFFPSVLRHEGYSVPSGSTQYRVPLGGQSAPMWNTPPHGPFRYDSGGTGALWTELPLKDEAVLEKLSRLRQLSPAERAAVQDLYFSPRVDLAGFAFLFANFGHAAERLIQEEDESARWAFFQREFARCHERCRRIAEHLADHGSPRDCEEKTALAWTVLRSLLADENRATSTWVADSGHAPPVTWPRPGGGAFAALLGLTGTGLVGEFRVAGADPVVWRELRGGMNAFSRVRDEWNAPVPTVIPALDLALSPDAQLLTSVRNGLGFANATAERLGGLQGFSVTWKGSLLVECAGRYQFWTGTPTEEGEPPCCPEEGHARWRLVLRRGEKEWVILSRRRHGEEARTCSEAVTLHRGVYRLEIELEEPPPELALHADVCPQRTGFQVKYQGPDTRDRLATLPFERLYQERKNQPLSGLPGLPGALTLGGQASRFLGSLFTSSLRDVRNTYERALKAFLFADRFGLSAAGISDDGRSEIGYLLEHPAQFAGTAYYLASGAYQPHLADFDFNLFPVNDVYNPDFDYTPPAPYVDERTLTATSNPAASPQRWTALFDSWERVFEYTALRRATRRAPEHHVWLLFHEAAENQPDDPAQLLRYVGVDYSQHQAALRYFSAYAVTTADLEDERWPIRAGHGARLLSGVLAAFFTRDIRDAKPDLWAADNPTDLSTGNANLTQFVRDGSCENGEPRRYEHLKQLNDRLRDRARTALLEWLCAMGRVTLPDGTTAREARQLSELLLLDVEAGLCEKASRIEEAITAVQLYVQRARLGLEPGFKPGPEFLRLWDRHFATFRVWEACKRRDIYRENWVEFHELEQARKTEAFRFLEDQLRRARLTSPAPGGLEYWPPKSLSAHGGIAVIQKTEPSALQRLQPQREGLGLLGTPERQARSSWLAQGNGAEAEAGGPATGSTAQRSGDGCLPPWIETAVRLGTHFVRVAAAGVPPAALDFCRAEGHAGCCAACGKVHDPFLDEYYFWLIDGRSFTEPASAEPFQDPLWPWHDPDQVPKLLEWRAGRVVYLAWCRVHDGEFQQPRRSSEGVRIGAGTPDLVFKGRTGDSLRFELDPPVAAPPGYPSSPLPGFRYDLAPDSAIVLPLLVNDTTPALTFGLSSYPFFLYFQVGASLYPASSFSPAVAVGDHLRGHCRFEEALQWYACFYAPLERDNQWVKCTPVAANPAMPPGHESKCCDSTVVADAAIVRNRAIVLRSVETLLEWADSLMCRNTPEAFQQARLILDTAARILGETPRTIAERTDPHAPVSTVAAFVPRWAPLNPRLVSLYEKLRDRRSRIHACFNGHRLRSGVPNVDMPYWGYRDLSDGWRPSVGVCEDDDCCAPCKPYRFTVLIKQAQDLANEVKGLGSALLAAYEKGDAEYLASLRSMHELRLHAQTLSIHQNQWRANDWQNQSLQKTKEATQLRRTYTNNLFIADLIALEHLYESESISAINWRLASNVTEVGSQFFHLIPDLFVGTCNETQPPVGTKLAGFGAAVARAFGAISEYYGSEASLDLTRAGWERRRVEWAFEIQRLDIELQQIEDQILGANRQRDVAMQSLNNELKQVEDSAEVLDFLRDKFTNDALYLWMQKETAALYYKAYELALHAARSAQRAFRRERGDASRSFVPGDAWDSLHEGLLAGDRLQLALKQMEQAYYDESCREYELSKHVSLKLHAPLAFLELKAAGRCEIELPESLFDHDYPGHYMRQIRSVDLTVPCVLGPYVNVNCRLTLLSSRTRVDPRLSDAGEACCPDSPDCGAGYAARADDPRIVRQYSAVEAIATSTGQNDSGLFELNFRDEKYLPFELAGVVSRWRLELRPENNDFDLESLSDVVLHLNYTAREGGEALRAAAHCTAAGHLPGNGLRLFDARHDFPNAWYAFSDPQACECRYLDVRLARRMFPFVPGSPGLRVDEVHLFYETECATPSRHQRLELLDPESAKHCPPHPGCKPERIVCVASAEWPTLFHGVIAGHDRRLDPDCDVHLGSLRFPADGPAVRRVYLVARYRRPETSACAHR
jgi:hypothetical protein